jgi:PEP-CTERM motif
MSHNGTVENLSVHAIVDSVNNMLILKKGCKNTHILSTGVIEMKSFLFAAAASIALTTPAFAAGLLTNGDFETGTLSGWSASSIGSPISPTGGCPAQGRGWNASTFSNTGCSGVAAPLGTTAAYAMNDGPGATSYILEQSFLVPNSTVSAAFSFALSSVSFYSGNVRTLSADIFNGASLVGNLALYNVPFGDSDDSWQIFSGSTNLLNAFSGQTLSIRFTNFSPDTWTGPAGIGLDNVSLTATTGIPSVPEPASWALMIAGFGLVGAAMRRRVARVSFAV